jgi:hypothetical protein
MTITKSAPVSASRRSVVATIVGETDSASAIFPATTAEVFSRVSSIS